MNLKESIARLFGGTARVPSVVRGRRGRSQYQDLTAIGNATVFNCVSFLAKLCAQIEIKSTDPDVDRLLNNPSSLQTRYEYIHSVVWNMLVSGNAYSRKVTGPDGKVVRLLPYDPSEVKVEVRDGDIYYESTKWDTDPLPSDEVIHFRDNPDHELISSSRAEAAKARIRALTAADGQITRVFDGGIHITYVVSSEKVIPNAVAEEIQERLQNMYGADGSDRGAGLVLGSGMEITPIKAAPPADQDLRDTRADVIREIASLFNLPPFAVGGTGDTKYNNVTARLTAMFRDAVMPIMDNVTQKMTPSLGAPVTYDQKALLRGDLHSQTTIGVAACGGPYKSPNEVREMFGDEPTDDPEDNKIRKTAAGSAGMAAPGDRVGEFPSDDGTAGSAPDDE